MYNQWWELYDAQTEQIYYYNASTKNTSWERPSNVDIIPLQKIHSFLISRAAKITSDRQTQTDFHFKQNLNSVKSRTPYHFDESFSSLSLKSDDYVDDYEVIGQYQSSNCLFPKISYMHYVEK